MADWDERYKRGEHIDEHPHPLLVDFASNLVPGRALDVACGAGRHALWLAARGWQVTAVDFSSIAIDIVRERSMQRGFSIDVHQADLARHEFEIQPAAYDLIVLFNYLQRDLFPPIKDGTRIGGIVLAAIAMVDPDPQVKPMNPAYLLAPGELRSYFVGWELVHDCEGKPRDDPARRATAEIVARNSRRGL